MKFIGAVSGDGFLNLRTRQLIAKFMRTHAGRTVTIEVKKFIKQRTDNQNRFFHGPFMAACTVMYHDAGNVDLNEDDVKLLMKEQFGLRIKVLLPDGCDSETLKSTADYTTLEIEDFMEKIRAYYAQYGFQLPYPNEELSTQENTASAQ